MRTFCNCVRSDDPTPLEAAVAQQAQGLSALKAENSAMKAELAAMRTELNAKISNVQSSQGSTFVRWGRTVCPPGSDIIHTGYAGGAGYTNSGSGANRVCLTDKPVFDDHTMLSGGHGNLHGAQYWVQGHQRTDVLCVLCHAPYSATFMVPGTNRCPQGSTLQYHGHLTVGDYTHSAPSEYVCLDAQPEDRPGSQASEECAWFDQAIASLFLLLTLLNFGDWGTSGQAVTNWTADVILAKDEGNGNASFTTSKVSSNVSSSSPVNGTLLSERSSRSVTEAAGEPQKTSTIEPAAGHVTMPFTTANTDDEVTKIQPESTTTFDPARRVTTTSTTANIDDVVTEFQPENMATFDPADQVTRTPATANFSNVLTETEPGFYLLNVTACNFNYPFTIIPVRPAQNGVFEARGPVVTSHTNPWSFLCKCQLTPPDGLHLWALVETLEIDAESIPEDDQIFYLSINDDQWDRYDPDTFKEDFVISPSAYIYFSLQSSKNINSFYFRFSFFLIESSEKHKLPVTKITNTTGYITTFAFDGKIRYANYIYFQNAEVTVPAGYFLLVSFPHVDIQESPSCQLDGLSLALYESWQGSSQYWQEWIKCGRENIPAKIYNTSLSVDFSSDKAVSGTGFKMFYSIHPANQQPERLTSGLFNCSVPYFHTFQLHFSCNLATDCVEGEDEMDCPYKSYVCGPHLIDAGSKCLQYIEVGREITWYDAYQQCTDMGKRLVSPRTHTEWGMFTNILTYGKTTRPVFVGLTTSPSNMAAMYRDVWHWTDQTMAFYANMYAQHLAKPSCALVPAIHQDRLQPVACAASTYVNYLLCESDKPVNSTTTIMPTLSPGTRSTSQFLSEKGAQLTWCPGGHMTLDFLSCDPEAQCNFLQYATSCPLTSGGEVPMFECDSISQTFHYTLVCDHRRHCADGSDENFCVFDECPEQQCRNYQCVSSNQWCDGTRHCVDGSDEECLQIVSNVEPSVPPPAVVSLDGRGGSDDVTPLAAVVAKQAQELSVLRAELEGANKAIAAMQSKISSAQ
ncbi:hypothetical protein BaRGS_00004859, partial [Batillaria attramentaria]